MTDQLKQLSEAAAGMDTARVVSRLNELRGFVWGPDECGQDDAETCDEAVSLIQALEAQLTEARAREAVAYEVAAKVCTGDEDRPAKLSASVLRKMSIADQFAHEQVVLAFRGADAIRALTPHHTTTALEQIKQEARDEGKREAAEIVKSAPIRIAGQTEKTARAGMFSAILATLSEPKENSEPSQ